MIRFFFREDPEQMEEEQWAERVSEALWISQLMRRIIWGSGSGL